MAVLWPWETFGGVTSGIPDWLRFSGFVILSGLLLATLIVLSFAIASSFQKNGSHRLLISGLARLVLFAILTTLILQPVILESEQTPLKDQVLILVDRSESQDAPDRKALTDSALTSLKAQIDALPNTEAVTIETLASRGKPNSTALLLELQDAAIAAIAPDRLAGVFIISDGQVHDIPESTHQDTQDKSWWMDVANSIAPAPVHLLLSGSPLERDRQIRILDAPPFAMAGEPLQLRVLVEDFPEPSKPKTQPAETVPITINTSGKLSANAPADTSADNTVMATVGTPTTITLNIPKQTKASTFSMVLKVPPITDKQPNGRLLERTLHNNTALLQVPVIRDRLRVLLVSGQPNRTARLWRNVLGSDPSVDLIHFTILRSPTSFDMAAPEELSLIPFPIDELFGNKLDSFDLIIFDQYTQQGILPDIYMYNIARHTLNGGALMVMAGAEFATPLSILGSPLAAILPTDQVLGEDIDGFQPTVTPLGARHPVTKYLTGQTLPEWYQGVRTTLKPDNATETLLNFNGDNPLLVLSGSTADINDLPIPFPFNQDGIGNVPTLEKDTSTEQVKGRIALLNSSQLWTWQAGITAENTPSSTTPSAGLLLRNIVHWLLHFPDMELERLEAITDGKDLVIRYTPKYSPESAPKSFTASVTPPEGAADSSLLDIPLLPTPSGLFEARIPDAGQGLYHITLGTLQTSIFVGNPDTLEARNSTSSPSKLQPLVVASNGYGHWLGKEKLDTEGLEKIADFTVFKTSQNILPKINLTETSVPFTNRLPIYDRGATESGGTTSKPLIAGWLALLLVAGGLLSIWLWESRR